MDKEENNKSPMHKQFQIIYVDVPSSRRENITHHSLSVLTSGLPSNSTENKGKK